MWSEKLIYEGPTFDECKTPEPGLRQLLMFYYLKHFGEDYFTAQEYTNRYIENLNETKETPDHVH